MVDFGESKNMIKIRGKVNKKNNNGFNGNIIFFINRRTSDQFFLRFFHIFAIKKIDKLTENLKMYKMYKGKDKGHKRILPTPCPDFSYINSNIAVSIL